MLERIFILQALLNQATFIEHGIPVEFNDLHLDGKSDEPKGPNSVTNEWLSKYLLAMEDEVRELREELLWKWWSKDKLDMQNIRVEIIDILHFWVSLAMTAGLSAEDVFNIYSQKNEVNIKRLKSGYSKGTKTEDDNKGINL